MKLPDPENRSSSHPLLALAVVSAAVGLWLHDWRCLAAAGVLVFASAVLRDADRCERGSSRDGSSSSPTDYRLR
jgi:hypothetical protein